MLIASVEFVNVVLFLHIAAVLLAFGPTYSYAFFIAISESAHPRALPAIYEGIEKIDRVLVSGASIVVLATGIYLVEDIGWDWGEFFVNWGMVAILALIGLTHGFFRPRSRKLRDLALRDLGESGEGTLSDEYRAQSALVAKVGTVAGLIVLLTVYVMAAKPFA